MNGKWIGVVLLVFFSQGCASIPLSTMLSLRHFDEQDALALKPEQIKARIQVDSPAQLDINQAKLALSAETPDGTLMYDFPLVLISTRQIPSESGFFSDTPAKTEYELKLSDAAVANFNGFKSRYQDSPAGQYGLNVSAGFKETDGPMEKIVFSIHLKLADDEDYLLILDNAEIDLQK